MVALETAVELKKRGHKIVFLCFKNSKLWKEAGAAEIVTFTVNAGALSIVTDIIRIGRFIKKSKFELIHSHASKDLWLLVPALKLLNIKIPLVLTKHVGSFIIKKDVFHNFLYRRVSRALAISTIIKNNLLETTSLSAEKISIFYNAVDISRFKRDTSARTRIRNELKLKEKEIFIGMSARFTWGKGHEEFLYAAKKLSGDERLKFVIVGEPSEGENEYEEKIRNLCTEYNIDDHVIFTGFRSDMPEVLSAMDIFVFPSHSEAFGVALVEAMACGLPSVCTAGDGILDIAVEGETSFLFKKRNADDLTGKLKSLLANPVKMSEFGRNARARAVSLFDKEKSFPKLIDIYRQEIER